MKNPRLAIYCPTKKENNINLNPASKTYKNLSEHFTQNTIPTKFLYYYWQQLAPFTTAINENCIKILNI